MKPLTLLFAFVACMIPAAWAGTWSTTPWTNDASTGVTTAKTVWAYNLGNTSSPTVNGVTFTGVSGGSPAVAGKFSLTGPAFFINGHTNDLTALSGSGSAGLGSDFVYGGSPATLTLEGLQTGADYTISIFGVAWDYPDARVATFNSSGDTIVVDENALGTGKGRRIDYSFTATAATRTITVTPATANTFHFYSLALQRQPLFVTTNADSGLGSLRQTVADALPGAVIQFASPLSGQTVTLTSGTIIMSKSITISSADLPVGMTISGNHATQILRVTSGARLTLESLTLRDGVDPFGGAIRNVDSSLTMRNCTVTGCSATDGGAIHADSDLAGKKTTLINCTLTGNTATARGGAIYNDDGDTELIHCTISGNTNTLGVGGGVCTFSDSFTRTTVRHSIIAGNTGSDVHILGGSTMTFVSSNANIIGTGTGSPAFNQSADHVNADPMLLPLADYGGPLTTMPPLSGSLAIDLPIASSTGTDQRGVARDNAPDSGAVERGPIVTVTNTNDTGSGSLRAALAAVTVPDTRIRFASGLSGNTITLTSGHLQLQTTNNVEIDASTLPAGITISGGGTSRVMHNNPGILGLNRVTLANGASTDGGALISLGHLFATDCTFRNCQASGNGGALFLFQGRADLLRCAFNTNTAGQGAAIWQAGDGNVNLTNCTVSGNSCSDSSGTGGLYFSEGSHRLQHVTISDNHGKSEGPGGIQTEGFVSVDLNGCIIAGNTSESPYSDIILFGTTTTSGPNLIGVNDLFESKFPTGPLVGTSSAPLDPKLAPLGNYGGLTRTRPPFYDSPAIGIAGTSTLTNDQRGIARSGTITLGSVHDVPAIVTTAANSGAGSLRDTLAAAFTTNVRFDPAVFNGELADVITLTTPLALTRSVGIDGSTASNVTLSGGDANRIIDLSTGQETHIKALTLRDALATDGGAIRSQGRLTLDQCRLIENHANGTGGGGIQSSGDVTLRSCEFSGNTSASQGGAVRMVGAKFRAENCLFANNHGTNGGGVLRTNGGDSAFTNSILASNTTNGTGGAIWIQDSGAVLKLTHCTVTGNSAVGITWDSSFNTVTLENSIVAGNGVQNLARAPLQLGNNQITGTPKLAPLGNYGGTLRSMPPLPGAPVVEGGLLLATTPALDFRGAPRPGGSLPDLGAVEAIPLGNLGLASNDGDTIPDIFEGPGSPYPHLSASINNSALDTDGDGMTDANEIADSTDPLDPNSRLRVTYFGITAQNISFTTTAIDFTSFPGLSYSAEISSDLDFSDARVSSLGTATGFLFQTGVNLAPSERFVRIRRNP
ncbi:choice-of-anchor Q domain-containing protein [Luteolibacter soli]|uniref:Choice-of-anchor Q domain-containing protein n=1 Tax=Luteolibacter soli TaxID=3135280 RepID=A0ABU9AQS4_9BACT